VALGPRLQEFPCTLAGVARTAPAEDDAALVERLRAGDEAAFTRVFDAYHALLVRLALGYVRNPSIAEEVAQDAWTAALDSLDSFEHRSSFKTWIVRITVNRAKTLAVREGRSTPYDPTERGDADDAHGPTIPPENFYSWGLWRTWPDRWTGTPEDLALRREVREAIEEGLAGLPPRQRTVVILRDVEGFSAEEVCNVLEVSESSQRVLLHRGRARMRETLERVLKEERRR